MLRAEGAARALLAMSHMASSIILLRPTDLKMFLSIEYWLPVLTPGKNEAGSIPASRGVGGVISNKKRNSPTARMGKQTAINVKRRKLIWEEKAVS